MDRGPVVVREGTREWDTWPDEEVGRKGLVYWKTLVSADVTRSEALTMGIGRVPPGEALRTHRHLPPRSTSSWRGPVRSRSVPMRGPSRRDRPSSYPATPPLLGEHGAVGFAVRLRLCCGFVRRGRVHLRGVT